MSADSFLYFAYGSNMFTPWLCQPARCPSARFAGIAELSGHELRWHKHSKKDGSGKCDIPAAAAASVLGVLYEIAGDEKAPLDRAEGKGFGYDEIEVEVLSGSNPVRAVTYQATNTDPALRPYTWYRALVIAGAKEHGFPASYIAELEAAPADEDENRARHDEHMALIEGVRA
jgi:hypothetical protein